MGIDSIPQVDREVLGTLLRRSAFIQELRDEPLDRRELQDRLDVSRATIHRLKRLLVERDLIEKGRRDVRSHRIRRPARRRHRTVQAGCRRGAAARAGPRGGRRPRRRHRRRRVHRRDGDERGVWRPLRSGQPVRVAAGDDGRVPVRRVRGRADGALPRRGPGAHRGRGRGHVHRPVRLCRLLRRGVPRNQRGVDGPGELTILEHEDLPPYGIGVLSDRVVLSCYEQDIGTVRAPVDTAAVEAREWAERTFAVYREEARRLGPELVVE